MKKIGFKSLRQRILTGFLAVVLLTAVIIGYNVIQMRETNRQAEALIEQEMPVLIVNEQLAINMLERMHLLNSYVLYDANAYIKTFNNGRESSIALEEKALQLSDSATLEELIALKVEWGETANTVIERIEANDRDGAVSMMQIQLAPKAIQLIEGFKTEATESEETIAMLGEDMIDANELMIQSVLILGVVTVIVSVVLALVTTKAITSPIKKVTERMQAIGKGELYHPAFVTSLKDEAGQLMLATNDMNAHMHDLIEELEKVSSTVGSQSATLTVTAEEVTNGTDQIAVTMGELAEGAESQAMHAADLSEGMQSFNEQVMSAYHKGETVNEETKEASRVANEGRAVMRKNVEQMQEIDRVIHASVERVEVLDQSSKQISSMVSVIEDIAEQTNLLALNASIEAARAGEHGKGFSVVADEVRKLAEQVSASVKDITGTVMDIQRESSTVRKDLESGYETVQSGAKQMVETEKMFDRIDEVVNQSASGIDVISQALNDMSDRSKQLLSNVEEIASISEQSAAGVEETSASSQEVSGSMNNITTGAAELSALVVQMKQLVERFKL